MELPVAAAGKTDHEAVSPDAAKAAFDRAKTEKETAKSARGFEKVRKAFGIGKKRATVKRCANPNRNRENASPKAVIHQIFARCRTIGLIRGGGG